MPMLCYEDIKQTTVEWLWFPYLPFGKLTIIQGNPGEGKTYFAMMLTAACTNRKTFPNMEEIEPFNVIYQTAEDGMGDTIKPRLVEAGADLSRVMVIDDTEEALALSDDRIEKAIRQNQVRLLIIDPVQAFIGADVDMNRANEVRPVFRKLGMIAERTGCAIVLIGHTLSRSSSYIRDTCSHERRRRENALRYLGAHQCVLHAGHLHSRHIGYAEAGQQHRWRLHGKSIW